MLPRCLQRYALSVIRRGCHSKRRRMATVTIMATTAISAPAIRMDMLSRTRTAIRKGIRCGGRVRRCTSAHSRRCKRFATEHFLMENGINRNVYPVFVFIAFSARPSQLRIRRMPRRADHACAKMWDLRGVWRDKCFVCVAVPLLLPNRIFNYMRKKVEYALK